MEEEFGERYTEFGVWLLQGLGIFSRVPSPQALERDEAYLRKMTEEGWPNVRA